MKFSTRTVYGLRALLVLASRFGEGSLSVSQIAKKEKISTSYLEQILNALKKKGLVKSVRGPRGGYVLTKKPAETTLQDLFYALVDETLTDLSRKKNGISSEADEVAVGDFIFWKKFHASIDTGLSEMTLKDLIDEARRFKKSKLGASGHTFTI